MNNDAAWKLHRAMMYQTMIRDYAIKLGAKVKQTFSGMETTTVSGKEIEPTGTYNHHKDIITINEKLCAKNPIIGIVAIAHETGHHLSKLRNKNYMGVPNEKREQWAYLLG